MRRCLSVLALLVILGCPGCKKPVSKAEQFYQQALELKDAQRYDDALLRLRRAIDTDPALDKPYYEMGEIYEVYLDNYPEAIIWYDKFLGVSKNDEMKQRVGSIISQLRAMSGGGGTGAGKLSGPAKEAVDKAIADEKAKLEREYSQRQTALASQKEREFERLKDDLKKLNTEKVDLQSKYDEMKIERDAAVKKAEKTRGMEEIASLISSSTFKGSDKERLYAQKLVEKQAENDKARADITQERAKAQQFEGQVVRLRQQLAESGKSFAGTDTELQKRVRELNDEVKRLNEQIALLKQAEPSAGGADSTKLAQLQEQLAEAGKEKQQALDDKKQAESKVAALQQKIGKLEAASASGGDASAENQKLGLQIEKLRAEYNDLSAKRTAAEERASKLEEDIEKLQKLSPSAKSVADGGYSDLSDEIKKMQSTIDIQRKLVSQRDAEISSLTEQNIKLQSQVEGKQPADSSRQLIDELNKQLQDRDERITELNRNLEQALTDVTNTATRARDAETTLASNQIVPPPSTRTGTATGTKPAATTSAVRPTAVTDPSLPGGSATSPATRPTAATSSTPGSSAARLVRIYYVRAGDTLAIISQKVYGDREKWRAIYNYNRKLLPTAGSLREGMALYIPPQ